MLQQMRFAIAILIVAATACTSEREILVQCTGTIERRDESAPIGAQSRPSKIGVAIDEPSKSVIVQGEAGFDCPSPRCWLNVTDDRITWSEAVTDDREAMGKLNRLTGHLQLIRRDGTKYEGGTFDCESGRLEREF